MKALRFQEPGNVVVADEPDPTAGPGEVILKTHATGLCNSDVRVYLGEKHAAAGVVPGHEITGEIVEVGAGGAATVGQTVSLCPIRACGSCSFCRGGYRNRCTSRATLGYDIDGGIAEYVKVPRQLVSLGHLLPVDAEAAPHIRALVEPLACVLNSIESMNVRPGAPFAVVGGGPMGLMHMVAAEFYGAAPILVVEPEERRRAVAMELGAARAVHPEEAKDTAMEMTTGEGFPAVAMAVGFADALPTALSIVRNLGWVNLFAGFPPGSEHALDLNALHYEEVRLFGTQNAPFHLFGKSAEIVHKIPKLDRLVTHRYALPDAADAYSARLDKDGLKSAVIME